MYLRSRPRSGFVSLSYFSIFRNARLHERFEFCNLALGLCIFPGIPKCPWLTFVHWNVAIFSFVFLQHTAGIKRIAVFRHVCMVGEGGRVCMEELLLLWWGRCRNVTSFKWVGSSPWIFLGSRLGIRHICSLLGIGCRYRCNWFSQLVSCLSPGGFFGISWRRLFYPG